jgi:hypothetical protein
VFCGAHHGARAEFAVAARALGATLVEAGITLVYGGGRVGLMGVLADAVLEQGGEVVGVIPHGLDTKELAHDGLTEMHVVDSMHERKARMADLADGFVALPGGLGTLEEFFEIVTWAQLGIHTKPCGLLNVAGYYDKLSALLDHAVEEAFVKPPHRELILIEPDARRLLGRMRRFQAPAIEKRWISREEL